MPSQTLPSREMKVQKLFQKDMVIEGKENVTNEVLLQLIGTPASAQLDVDLNMSVWRCLYRRALLIDNMLSFKSEREFISEDIIFHLETFSYINKISTVAEPMYYYRCNENSLTRKYRADRFERECYLFSGIKERINQNKLGLEAITRAQRSFIGRARNCLEAEVRDNKSESMMKRMKNMKNIVANQQLHSVLCEYPINKLNKKLFIVSLCMKYKMVMPLYFVFSLKDTRK